MDKILEAIRKMNLGEVHLMEVCGTHTMAIARSGIKKMLPENIHLLSGPGCPVCVTPEEVIDQVLELSSRPNVLVATYGDMIRVPGSSRGDNLAKRKALGAKVEIVYSPIDAVEIAKRNPDQQVVFLGVGFETTAPGTAAAVCEAAESNLDNFSVFSMLKMVEPALRTLTSDPEFNVQGFLCPGHVATIIGEAGLQFVADELHIPAVIAGFEPMDILKAVYLLLRQIESGQAKVENQYRRAVMPEGNPLARKMVEQYFEPREDIWRGLGAIEKSGLGLRDEYGYYDAEKRFQIQVSEPQKRSACRCGEVIRGKISPQGCPLFGKVCLPEEPVGPCMVSSEGACAAAYKYQEI